MDGAQPPQRRATRHRRPATAVCGGGPGARDEMGQCDARRSAARWGNREKGITMHRQRLGHWRPRATHSGITVGTGTGPGKAAIGPSCPCRPRHQAAADGARNGGAAGQGAGVRGAVPMKKGGQRSTHNRTQPGVAPRRRGAPAVGGSGPGPASETARGWLGAKRAKGITTHCKRPATWMTPTADSGITLGTTRGPGEAGVWTRHGRGSAASAGAPCDCRYPTRRGGTRGAGEGEKKRSERTVDNRHNA